ncbi:MAG: hypothetical protein KA324_12025 [Rubrivivax sp.]|nr:hypothetical protein [Betaproteobacteria bacterium]MBK8108125.1 hypothetical protein [Betaproteobacteria bacterium]MBK9682709.1 hypothetical protein [Betaproteobacteria bacterium]MBP6464657.1 hypothetical protein [Rubrivivax sp.]
MSKTLRRATAALLLTGTAAALGLAAALQHEATVPRPADIGPQDLARAAALLRAHDPRRVPPGRLSTMALSGRDLEVLFNHGLHRWPGAAGRVDLQRAAIGVTLSAPVPPNPFGRWLNVTARWVQTERLPRLDSLHVGRLRVPVRLGQWVGLKLIERADLRKEWQLTAEVVLRVRLTPQRLLLAYAWRDDSAQRVLETLLPADEQQRLRAHAEHLSTLVAALAPAREAPLAQLLGPMFELAQQRSAAGGDAAAENRAAIVVLALFANGRDLGSVLPGTQGWPRAQRLRLLLAGRDDFPRHFLVSAALVVGTSDALAQSIGLKKELADARSGSGFSFNDMAANLAGARFGAMALQAPAELQARVAPGVGDDDLMPAWVDLPQFMPEAEFVRRYGGVGAPRYQAMMAEIERRVGALRLFR